MVRRQSELFLPTLRDDPADADAISHKLLVRAGLIRQVSAGLWSFLPAGWRTHERIVQVVREEMDAIGGQEMFMPVITPAELWEKTGRNRIPELFRFDDRGGRAHVLALTHEETVTFHFAELGSYRDLPKILYHFQTKGRDEARPRGGLLRVREFVMKDAYTFDRDEEGLDRQLPEACTGVRADLRALRAGGRRSAGRVGDDGRKRVDRLPGSVRIGREHPGHLRERRLRGRSRDRARHSAVADVPRPTRRPCGGGDPGDSDDRRTRSVPGHRSCGDVEGDARDEGRRDRRSRACARRRPARGGQARSRTR